MARRLDSYVRVSRVGGRSGASFISPDVQRDQIRAWAQAHGVEITGEYVDLDQSGGTTDRPQFNEVMRRIQVGETGGIVVAKIDRFARSASGALEAIKRIDDAGGEFVSVQDGIDPSTAVGKMQRGIFLLLAEFDLDRITEQWQVAMERAIDRGVHFRLPLGYDRGDDGRMVPNDVAPAVRDLFHLRGEAAGWADIARHLNEHHPREVDWMASILPKLVRNRAYLGEAYHGDFRNAEAHEPLVTAAEWEAAQRPRAPTIPRGDGTLLAGLLRCAGCRYVMRPDRGGKRVPVYRCQVNHGVGRCPAPASVTRHVVDDFVEQQFFEHFRPGLPTMEPSETTDVLDQVRARVTEADAELDLLASDVDLRRSFGHERYRQVVAAAAGEAREARAALEAAQRAAFGLLVPEFADWSERPTAQRRAVLAEGIDAIFLRRTGIAPIAARAKILWLGEAEDLSDPLPGRTFRPDMLVPYDW